MIYKKYYTVKEWKRFNRYAERENGDDITAQEIMLRKYDIILTDYKINPLVNYRDLNKKELTVKVLKNFNMNNFNKGMKIFNDGVKGFTSSIDAVTSQLGHNEPSQPKRNNVKIWSTPKKSKSNQIKIWSDPPKKKRKYRHKPVQDRHKQNLQSIWGKK